MKRLVIFSILFLFLFSLNFNLVLAAEVKAPSILLAEEKLIEGKRVLEVRGLAPADSDVLVYIDLQVAGIAKVKNEGEGLSSFFYSEESNLPGGTYSVSAVARDKNTFVVSSFSASTNVTESKVVLEEKEVPKVFPPTLLRSVVDSESSYNRPKIIGQGIAGHRIEVFVDGVKDGQLLLDKERPGTIQFIYLPQQELSSGQHRVYLFSYDEDNNRSERSNEIYINVSGETPGRIDAGENESPDEIIIPEEMTDSQNEGQENDLQQILGIEPSTSTEVETGMIDSDRESQSRVKLNLIIFLLFLAAIIIWIFWVNRELIKEKEKENDSPEKRPVGDVEKSNLNDKKNEVEYGIEKDKDDPDVLKF